MYEDTFGSNCCKEVIKVLVGGSKLGIGPYLTLTPVQKLTIGKRAEENDSTAISGAAIERNDCPKVEKLVSVISTYDYIMTIS